MGQLLMELFSGSQTFHAEESVEHQEVLMLEP